MQGKQTGPPGLENWEAVHAELFARHGATLTTARVLDDAPAVVRELAALVEAYPLLLTWDGQAVGLKEKDKAQAGQVLEVVRRCVDIVADYQEEVREWLAPMIR